MSVHSRTAGTNKFLHEGLIFRYKYVFLFVLFALSFHTLYIRTVQPVKNGNHSQLNPHRVLTGRTDHQEAFSGQT